MDFKQACSEEAEVCSEEIESSSLAKVSLADFIDYHGDKRASHLLFSFETR